MGGGDWAPEYGYGQASPKIAGDGLKTLTLDLDQISSNGLKLQEHGQDVRYRNIWIVDKSEKK